jgi:hypothetical protein
MCPDCGDDGGFESEDGAMDELTSAHLIALAEHHRNMLRGRSYARDPFDPTTLGPLAGLVVAGDAWRSDGLALSHRLLEKVITEWAAKKRPAAPRRSAVVLPADEVDLRRPRRYRSTPDDDIARVLRAHWGLSQPPARRSLSGWAEELEVSPRTPATWPARVMNESSVALAAQLAPELIGDTEPPSTNAISGHPSAIWEGGPHDWPGGTHDGPELLRRAERAWNDSEADDPTTQRLSEREAMWSIRRVIVAELRRGYLDRRADELVRDIEHRVVRAWEDLDRVLVPTESIALERELSLENLAARRGPQSLALRAVLQLHAFLATDDQPVHRSLLREQNDNLRFGLRFVSADEAERRRQRHTRRSEQLYSTIRRAATGGLAPVDIDLQCLSLPGFLHADAALRATNKIRGLSSPADRILYLEQYVRKRQELPNDVGGYDDRQARTRRSLQLFGLADQAADLSILDSDAVHLRRPMAAIIRANSAHRYELFPERNAALALAKREAFMTASARIGAVYEEAEARADEGPSGDAQETLETLHQVSLAATGILTGAVELLLTTRRPEATPALAVHTGALLHWRDLLEQHLEELTQRAGQPTARHEDGTHIYWRDWAVTTTQNAARASIVATTALDAFGLERPSDRDGSLGAAMERYLRLITSPDLRPTHEASVVMPGTWLAMLNGNRLVTRIVAPSEALAGMTPVVDVDRQRSDTTAASGSVSEVEIPFRHRESAQWHIRRDDGGKLATLPHGGVAWTHLVAQSGGAFAQWFEDLDYAGLVPERARNPVTRRPRD